MGVYISSKNLVEFSFLNKSLRNRLTLKLLVYDYYISRMSDELGEKLAGVETGDVITVVAGGDRYTGTVSETVRQKCELNQGFMESGHLAVYLEFSTTSVEDYKTRHIVISAEEEVPRSWDQPTASAYDRAKEQPTARLGEVTTVETGVDK